MTRRRGEGGSRWRWKSSLSKAKGNRQNIALPSAFCLLPFALLLRRTPGRWSVGRGDAAFDPCAPHLAIENLIVRDERQVFTIQPAFFHCVLLAVERQRALHRLVFLRQHEATAVV